MADMTEITTKQAGNLQPNSSPIDDYSPNLIDADDTKSISSGVYSNLGRGLQEDDLKAPGTQKLILAELDRYERCKDDLEKYRKLYHDRDKETAMLKTQVLLSSSSEILYSLVLTASSIVLGLVPSIFTIKENETPTITIILGIILGLVGLAPLITAIVFKVRTQKTIKEQLDSKE